jgi:hypothetical protein
MTKKDIVDAIVWMRKHNSTIPSEVLDFMKDASIKTLHYDQELIFIRKCISENLRADKEDADKPYIAMGPTVYTKTELAKAIEDGTPHGIRVVENVLVLGLDILIGILNQVYA